MKDQGNMDQVGKKLGPRGGRPREEIQSWAGLGWQWLWVVNSFDHGGEKDRAQVRPKEKG